MVQIVKAGMEHLDEFAELFNNYRIFYRQPSDLEKGKNFLRERITNGESDTFLALVDGKAVGFAQLYSLFHYKKLERQWLLSDLFVDPNYRGRGLSVMIIDRCKAYCDETNACGLLLETEKTNVIGNQLYPRTGFEVDNEHNYYNWWKA
ncbi:GNAT family N-acetyltransferase [Chitinophaga sp. G-6-1-13]|uniref:GNAT family N-acetyltransferase n=1 Tax=Chitinophaga fulva TaxID=2728842 RepID=A0A848GVE1_9BACT|nr:GNAT family N-acetyltransferase [Chitinophaga fulva]NML40673.1 GNAT family N-acetyltransferase [Chitinophaga fulva]